jgi:hypothetical protein
MNTLNPTARVRASGQAFCRCWIVYGPSGSTKNPASPVVMRTTRAGCTAAGGRSENLPMTLARGAPALSFAWPQCCAKIREEYSTISATAPKVEVNQ